MIEQPTMPDRDLIEVCRKHAAATWALLNMQVSTIETYNLLGTKVPESDAAVARGLLIQTVAYSRLVELLEGGCGVESDPGESSYTTRLVTRALTGTFAETESAEPAEPEPTTETDPDVGFGEDF